MTLTFMTDDQLRSERAHYELMVLRQTAESPEGRAFRQRVDEIMREEVRRAVNNADRWPQVDLVALIRESECHLEDKGSGKFVGDHRIKHDSSSGTCLVVWAQEGRWCSSCKNGGDAAQWVMSTDGVDHPGAARMLRERFGSTPQLPGQGRSPRPGPILEAALHGPAGELVRVIEPHTEADPVAVLAQTLVIFGSVIGRNAHFRVESDVHYLNLYAVLVGQTSRGRKGTSYGRAKELFEQIDPDWAIDRVQAGLSSGEARSGPSATPSERPRPSRTRAGPRASTSR